MTYEHRNIVIGDESALFFHLHSDMPTFQHEDGSVSMIVRRGFDSTMEGESHSASRFQTENPLSSCAHSATELSAFNVENPLYGGAPVIVLTDKPSARRRTKSIYARSCTCDLPASSFWKLRDGLFIASPELCFVRMARSVPETKLAEIGMNLCAQYYLDPVSSAIGTRAANLTTVEKLRSFATSVKGMHGSAKALRAIRWVLDNSASPFETKMKLQLCQPLWTGGLALPFTAMNYMVKIDQRTKLSSQHSYSIDLANPELLIGVEYDGEEYHRNTSADKRRRNELAALGWTIFPIEKEVLQDPVLTEKTALQIAKTMKIRIQKPRNWQEKYVQLRKTLDLPI